MATARKTDPLTGCFPPPCAPPFGSKMCGRERKKGVKTLKACWVPEPNSYMGHRAAAPKMTCSLQTTCVLAEMATPWDGASPGQRITVWWEGEGAWFPGRVGGELVDGGRRVVVDYDDGDRRTHDLRNEQWVVGAPGRRPHETWNELTEEEAIRREWKGYPLSSERGRLQLYKRYGMAGVGVWLAPTAAALEMPRRGECDVVAWFDGELFGALGAAARRCHARCRRYALPPAPPVPLTRI